MTMWKEDFVLHLKWAAARCPTLAVMGMFADVIYGDKTVGAYAWAFFNDGANKHTPIITYHQIDDTNQSIRVKFYYYSAIYFCAKKREEISEEREKNTSLFYEEEEESPSKHLQQKKIEKKIEKKKRKRPF